MLVKSKNCFVDLSLTSTRFLAPNFLITAEHESPPKRHNLKLESAITAEWKSVGPPWDKTTMEALRKTAFPVTRLYLEAPDGVLILTIFLQAAVCETRLLTTVAHPQILWKQPAGVTSCSD